MIIDSSILINKFLVTSVIYRELEDSSKNELKINALDKYNIETSLSIFVINESKFVFMDISSSNTTIAICSVARSDSNPARNFIVLDGKKLDFSDFTEKLI